MTLYEPEAALNALYSLGCTVIGIVATAMLTDYTNKAISAEYEWVRPAQPRRNAPSASIAAWNAASACRTSASVCAVEI